MTKEEILELYDNKTKKAELYYLVIHNDDVNSFNYVIFLLTEYCGLNFLTAEQYTLISHNKGKCDVKKGGFEEMKKLKDILIENGLGATLERI